MSAIDGGNIIDWSWTSQDYSVHRPSYPHRLFDMLASLGVGLAGQRLLDLGTGVGFLAEQFARQRVAVTGIDISEAQINEARRRCAAQGLSAQFEVGPAEDTSLPSGVFDVVTAGQCWLYFDHEKAIREVKRLLRPGGLLVTCHFCWLPRQDRLAAASEALALQHNPKWTGADWTGHIPLLPKWAEGHFSLRGMFAFDEPIAFTRDSWRGRFRACRGVGASLSGEQVERFDREHDALLRAIAPEQFSVLHRIDAHVLQAGQREK